MTTPVFSIITITENNASGLQLTGKSLMQQFDAPVFEWIIIDGASTDQTADLIRQWDHDFIRFIAKNFRNASHAHNLGLSMATGHFVWFMPAGDCFSDIYVLRDLFREYRRNLQADLIYGDARDHGVIHKARDFASLMQRPIIPFQAMLYRRSLIGSTIWDETLQESADYDFTLRFQDHAKQIHYMPRLLCDIDTSYHTDERHIQKLREQHQIRAAITDIARWKNTVIYYRDLFQRKFFQKK